MRFPRDVEFLGRSLSDLRSFTASARQQIGRELRRLQSGLEPTDWKPMATIGSGVSEIRVRDQTGAFRVIYVAKFEDAIFVLHCFEKKSQKTSRTDLAVAASRYRALIAARRTGR